MVFQTAALFDGSVFDNVLYGARLRGTAADGARKGAGRAALRPPAPHSFYPSASRRRTTVS
jgi:ABC-type phosphate transport system ATPase subunit